MKILFYLFFSIALFATGILFLIMFVQKLKNGNSGSIDPFYAVALSMTSLAESLYFFVKYKDYENKEQ
jgi:hypothetical protein